MEKINPNAFAQTGDPEDDARPDVQEVTAEMIFAYVSGELKALPPYSARPFSEWLDECWNDFNEDSDQTIGDVITGALSDWRGGCRH